MSAHGEGEPTVTGSTFSEEQVAELVVQQRIIVRTVDMDIEVDDVSESLDNIASLAREFNGWVVSTRRSQKYTGYISLRVPADRLEYDIEDMVVSGATINLSQVSIGTRDGARSSLAKIDQAIHNTAKERGTVGALLNRLEYTINFTANSLERVNASESTVRDADFAWESSHLTRNQIVSQASTAVTIQSRLPVEMIMGLLQ